MSRGHVVIVHMVIIGSRGSHSAGPVDRARGGTSGPGPWGTMQWTGPMGGPVDGPRARDRWTRALGPSPWALGPWALEAAGSQPTFGWGAEGRSPPREIWQPLSSYLPLKAVAKTFNSLRQRLEQCIACGRCMWARLTSLGGDLSGKIVTSCGQE